MAMKLPAAHPLSDAAPDGRPPRRRRKEARPSELTAAALALFVEKGFAGTRLEDVAARAGVSKGTLYLYFESKEALFKAVIEEGMVAALAAAEQRLSDFQGSAAELLRHSPHEVADLFLATRGPGAAGAWGVHFGTLGAGTGFATARSIVRRASVFHHP